MLTERTIIGKIEIVPNGTIQIREDTIVERDGVEIARTYHRRLIEPGTDVSQEADPRISAVTAAIWTDETVTAYQDEKQAAEAQLTAAAEPLTKPLVK